MVVYRRGLPPYHGDNDTVVPASQSEHLHALLTRAGAESTYRTIPGAGHCFENYSDVAGLIDDSVKFFDTKLAQPGA
ncbi:alpha/beta hydrolase family protein [Nocardia sp. NPDC049149]|uniref:alpha/beta hydrolase family protein n=1 Tax=Nocardia sp. NPDC049149 TaxID=3364315 RepID=UPI00371D9BA8